MCPQTSANSRRPPGDDNADAQQMTIEVERIVLDPPG